MSSSLTCASAAGVATSRPSTMCFLDATGRTRERAEGEVQEVAA